MTSVHGLQATSIPEVNQTQIENEIPNRQARVQRDHFPSEQKKKTQNIELKKKNNNICGIRRPDKLRREEGFNAKNAHRNDI